MILFGQRLSKEEKDLQERRLEISLEQKQKELFDALKGVLYKKFI